MLSTRSLPPYLLISGWRDIQMRDFLLNRVAGERSPERSGTSAAPVVMLITFPDPRFAMLGYLGRRYTAPRRRPSRC